MSELGISEQKEIIQEFVTEGREILDELDPCLIELENVSNGSEKSNKEVINSVFRLFHSLKGGAGFLELDTIKKVTHEAETLLDLFRDGAVTITGKHIELLCRACDFIRQLFDSVESQLNDKGFDGEAHLIVEKLRGAIKSVARDKKSLEKASFENIREDILDSLDDFKPAITPEIIKHFVDESDNLIKKAEKTLHALEKSPDNLELVGVVFQSIHSFKGNAGFFGFGDLEHLSQRLETLLDAIKKEAAPCDKQTIGTILKIINVLRANVAKISEGTYEKVENCKILLDLIDDVSGRLCRMGRKQGEDKAREEKNGGAVDEVNGNKTIGEILIEMGATTREAVEEALARQNAPLGEVLVNMGAVTHEHLESALAKQKKGEGSTVGRMSKRQDIRVDIQKMDALINFVGELVIAESMVTNNPDLRGLELERFEKAARHLNRIIRGLQDVAMSLRMIPILGTFRKMIRLVHDLTAKSGKKVDLKMFGEDTEVDKTVTELVADPLVHIIRNAVDHGIETPKERRAVGKPEIGEISMEAKHSGGEVLIIITDDGRGLNRDKIIAHAAKTGFIRGDGADMSDEDVWQLIFEPGFSTANKVTDVSGRGVGMDVVKKNIERLNGRVEVHSKTGEGIAISLRIPLTLAIIDGMVVRVGSAYYTIPMVAIKESFKTESRHITTTMDGQEVVRLRDKLHPVVRLHETYNITPSCSNLMDGIMILLENESKSICLFADELMGQQQVVIKGLSNYVGNIRGVSGCAILGDGDISLILDTASLIKSSESEYREETHEVQ